MVTPLYSLDEPTSIERSRLGDVCYIRKLMKIAIEPAGPVKFDLAVPGSKSLTNRALIAAALAPGTSRLTNASASDDSHVLSRALGQVGIKVESPDPATIL